MLQKVVILQEWVPHYREPFFKYLREIGFESGIQYLVIAGSEPHKSQEKSHQLISSEVDIISKNSIISLFGRDLLFQRFSRIDKSIELVVCEHALRNLRVNTWFFFGIKKRLAFWGHGKTHTKKITRIEENLKNLMLRRAVWYFSYTKAGVDYIISKGFSKLNVTCLFNSTDTKDLLSEINRLSTDEIENFKSKYSINSDFLGVYIGTLTQSKRLEFLIEASILIKKEIPEFKLIIFGEGPMYPEVQKASEMYSFISYGGEANTHTKALLAKSASIIMMPGRVGLISVDSFAMGIPIITTNWDYHAPEYSYLTHGYNSVITRDSLPDYVKGVVELLQNKEIHDSLKINCKKDVELFSIEKMAHNFNEGVLAQLSGNKFSKKYDLFGGLLFPIQNLDHALSIFQKQQFQEGTAVHFVNSYSISQAFLQPELMNILRSDLLIPDGTPLSKFLSIYNKEISSTRGPDFMREFLLQSTSEMTHFFLGSTTEVVSKLIQKVSFANENLNVRGFHCPEQIIDYSLYIQEWSEIIRKSEAKYVWVGLGTPKQDYVAHELSKILPATCFAVGAAFDYISGDLKEAPEVFRNSGFEWLYRLKVEPLRLWKRYLMGNTHFIFICLREFWKLKKCN